MRLTLDALMVLDAIDRAGSFAAGAERLFRVPSAVSYTIHKLELDLGVAVFDRSGHRAKLTSAGVRLLEDGRELLRLADALERRVAQGSGADEPRLTIGVGDVIPPGAVYPLLSAFYEAPGRAATHIEVTRETQATCWAALLSARSDLVIGACEPCPSGGEFHTQPLGEIEMALAVPAAHPLARCAEPLAGRAISQHRVVRQAASPSGNHATDASPNYVTVDDYGSLVEAIRHGLGVGYVPTYLVRDDVTAGRLVTKTVADAPRVRLTVAWRAAKPGPALRWLLDQLRGRELRAHLLSSRAD
jgi:DNA-binding transcriptional LysR family regulator